MDLVGSERAQHALTTAITRIDLSLQFLEQHTMLSEQQHLVVAAALRGIADLNSILQDGVDRQPSGLTTGTT
jgi:hypothetical protein